MVRKVANPPNPFTSAHREYLDEPPNVEVEIYEETAKSILSTNDSPDIPFRWSVNPYRGCRHACAYCYARPTHEYLGLGAGTDFDTKITIKINAGELLERAVAKPSWKRELIAFSGVTDCYQPHEAVYCVTRRCLEVCERYANPVGVITKSFLIARDVDLLGRLAETTRSMVYFSIAFADDRRARLIEPGAPPPSRRFEAMRTLHAAGVRVGVMLAPVMPGLNDREIPAILEQAAACGAQTAGYSPLRLPGSVKDVFLDRLRIAIPDAAERVENLIRDARGGRYNDSRFGARMRAVGGYWDSVKQLFEVSARKFGLDKRPAAACPADSPLNYRQLPLFR